MGGIIEDKIFDALGNQCLTVKGVQKEMRNLRPSYDATCSVIRKHMLKMFRLRQLKREKESSSPYVYWIPTVGLIFEN